MYAEDKCLRGFWSKPYKGLRPSVPHLLGHVRASTATTLAPFVNRQRTSYFRRKWLGAVHVRIAPK